MRRLFASALVLLALAGCDTSAEPRAVYLGSWFGTGERGGETFRLDSEGHYESVADGSAITGRGTFEARALGEPSPFGESAYAVTYDAAFGPSRPDAVLRFPSYNEMSTTSSGVSRTYVRAP